MRAVGKHAKLMAADSMALAHGARSLIMPIDPLTVILQRLVRRTGVPPPRSRESILDSRKSKQPWLFCPIHRRLA
jgi:hypothetical protein